MHLALQPKVQQRRSLLRARRLQPRQILRKSAQMQTQQLPLARQPLRYVSGSNKTPVRSCKWLPDMTI
jgi:hypothetical protein